MIEDRLVTAPEAARIFGLPVHLVYQWKRDRKITPCHVVKSPGRLGETWYYRLSEVARTVADEHADQQEPTGS